MFNGARRETEHGPARNRNIPTILPPVFAEFVRCRLPDPAPRHVDTASAKLARVRLPLAIVSLCLLTIMLIAAWAHRFEAAPDVRASGVEHLTSTGTKPVGLRIGEDRIALTAGGRPRHATFTIPGAGVARHIHIHYQAETIGLERGDNPWDDGRLFIEWLSPDGKNRAFTSIHSARGDRKSPATAVVIHAPVDGAVPRLRLENLGKSGTYTITKLHITPARERAVWSIGRWALIAGFIAALAALVHNTKKPARWRGFAAASVWVFVAIHYVIPGPWDVARPFGVPLAFQEPATPDPEPVATAGSRAPSVPPTTSPSPTTPPAPRASDAPPQPEKKSAAPTPAPTPAGESDLGRLPDPDDFGLRIKRLMPVTRPLLHIALLFAPTLVFAWCVGIRRAFILGMLLSLSIEAAQILFGFGFGWDDVGDLIYNAVGIAAALWAHHKFARRVHSRLPVPLPEPA